MEQQDGSWKQHHTNVNVEDKLYAHAEYGKLTNVKKSKLAWLWSQRDDGYNNESNTARIISAISVDDFKKLMDQRISGALTTQATTPPVTNNCALVCTGIAPI